MDLTRGDSLKPRASFRRIAALDDAMLVSWSSYVLHAMTLAMTPMETVTTMMDRSSRGTGPVQYPTDYRLG